MSIKKIKKSREFNYIYNSSKKVYTKYAIIFMSESRKGQRFGFVASKKTGNAVQRNRIKRLFREFARQNSQKMNKDYDYVFVGKAILKDNIRKMSYKDIERDMMKVIRQ